MDKNFIHTSSVHINNLKAKLGPINLISYSQSI